MKEEVRNGVIDIGEPVVARMCTKKKIDSRGQIKEIKTMIEGRKHPIVKLRKRLLHRLMQFMRLDSDEFFASLSEDEILDRCKKIGLSDEELKKTNTEGKIDYVKKMQRTRCLKMWHDGSGIENHGHILFCVSILYDPHVFYTDAEYFDKFKTKISVQQIVERPELYIIGRCRNNDEQLSYIPTRRECIESLKIGLKVKTDNQDIIINDVMRIFCGDGPAGAMESGNQKGGHYFCSSCGVHLSLTHEMAYTYQQKYFSFNDRIEMVTKGIFGKKTNTCPFDLNPKELVKELDSRKVDRSGYKETKKDLEPLLKQTLKGIKRVPILVITDPLANIQHIGLGQYEICMLECMHDLAGHIDNVVTELPHHVKDTNEKLVVKNLVESLKQEKNMLRCCDKRRILLILAQTLKYKVNGNISSLLLTLAEIQRILYLHDDFRTAQCILRLHNQCHQHFVLMKEVFDISHLSSGMTRDKLYGKYCHDILSHAPIQYRIISGMSINCEEEERIFNLLKNVTHNKTNHRDGHAIGNMVVRCEYKRINKELFSHDKSFNNSQNDIQDIGKKVEEFNSNTVFTYDYIKNNSADWQCHLERISDFLVLLEGTWWRKTSVGIEFLDIETPDNIPNPKVHHFRSASIDDVIKDLDNHWRNIIKNETCIPIHVIHEGSEDEPARSRSTTFLKDFIPALSTNNNIPSVVPDLFLNEEDNCDDDETGLSPQEIMVDVDDLVDVIPTNQNIYQSIGEHYCTDVNIQTLKERDDEPSLVSPMIIEPSEGESSKSLKDTSDLQTLDLSNFHEQHNIPLNTLEANTIYQILEPTSEEFLILNKFDRKLSAQNNPLVSINDILDCRAPLETLVLKAVSSLKKEYQTLEKSFMLNNDLKVPSVQNLDQTWQQKWQRMIKGEKLLRHWQIYF